MPAINKNLAFAILILPYRRESNDMGITYNIVSLFFSCPDSPLSITTTQQPKPSYLPRSAPP